MPSPKRGEIWLVELDPGTGHEQSGRRPYLIVSSDIFNSGRSGLVLGMPLTSKVAKSKNIIAHIPIDPPEGGIKMQSIVLCDQLRSISRDRLLVGPWGTVSAPFLNHVEAVLRSLLQL